LVTTILNLLAQAEVDGLPPPSVVPASGGGIQLEWHLGVRELEIEFHSQDSAEYIYTDTHTGAEVEKAFRPDYYRIREVLAYIAPRA
jgi:hypothetical protein